MRFFEKLVCERWRGEEEGWGRSRLRCSDRGEKEFVLVAEGEGGICTAGGRRPQSTLGWTFWSVGWGILEVEERGTPGNRVAVGIGVVYEGSRSRDLYKVSCLWRWIRERDEVSWPVRGELGERVSENWMWGPPVRGR